MLKNKHRLIFIAFWLLLSVLAVYQLLVNTRIQSDMLAFMSEQTDVKQNADVAEPVILQANKLLANTANRIWLLGLSGADAGKLAETSQQLTNELHASGYFVQVHNGAADLDNTTRQLLVRYRYLLDTRIDENYFSVNSLNKAFQQRLSDLASPLSSLVKKWLPSDPVGASMHIMELIGMNKSSPEIVDGVWFTTDHKKALLMLETRAKGMALDAQEEINSTIDKAFKQVGQGLDITLEKSGMPVIALQSREQIKTESQRLSITAGLFMLFFLGWVYISPVRVILSTLPLLGGLLFAASAVSFLFGSIHGITLAFGITLLGVAVDYPVHAFSHSRASESFSVTINRIWPTLRLGVFTTILGYAAMAMTDLTGLAQLGVFSITGLSTAALLTRSLLPALTPDIYPRQPQLLFLAQRLDVNAGKGLYVVMVLLSLLLLSNLWRAESIWSEDIAELSPVPNEVLLQYHQFREQTGISDAHYFILVDGKDIESVLQSQEELNPLLKVAVANGELQGFEMLSKFIPSQQQQTQRQALLPDSVNLHMRLTQALQDLPLHPQIFEPFIKDVAQTRTLKSLTMDDLASTPLGVQLQGLLLDGGEKLFGLVRLRGVIDPEHIRGQLKNLAADGIYFVDTKANANRLLHNFRIEALLRISWALALIIIILWLGLRDARRIFRVMLPVLLAVAIAASVPLWLGEKLNLFHLVSLLLVAGIGLDYGLFFSRTSTDDGVNTLHALLVCAISTSTVFAMLAFSGIPVLHSIGTTVSVGIVAAFVWSWLLSRTTRT